MSIRNMGSSCSAHVLHNF
uniref:Uncharacterized protein n=1 Tax=Arundo donax TaxID=35708 RepID=A0A0A9AWI3_ARUDO